MSRFEEVETSTTTDWGLLKQPDIALRKLGRGGSDDELVKPLITVQWVQVPPD
jgi:hypothetical protein